MSAAWKDLERRVCVALGGRRAGPLGQVSDCVNVPFAVEVKRSSRLGPPVLAKWILQARAQGKREQHPWLLVVAGHHDRQPVAVMDFATLVSISMAAGLIPPASVPTPRPDYDPHLDHPERYTDGKPV